MKKINYNQISNVEFHIYLLYFLYNNGFSYNWFSGGDSVLWGETELAHEQSGRGWIITCSDRDLKWYCVICEKQNVWWKLSGFQSHSVFYGWIATLCKVSGKQVNIQAFYRFQFLALYQKYKYFQIFQSRRMSKGVRSLLHGIMRYRTDWQQNMLAEFRRVRDNPDPTAVFVTCVDSRMLPTRFTQTNVGDMFIIRNAGNMVPHRWVEIVSSSIHFFILIFFFGIYIEMI